MYNNMLCIIIYNIQLLKYEGNNVLMCPKWHSNFILTYSFWYCLFLRSSSVR